MATNIPDVNLKAGPWANTMENLFFLTQKFLIHFNEKYFDIKPVDN